MNEEQSFKAWCIVELFGHVTLAGYVSEQTIGGASFIRLDVPAVEGQAEFTKLIGASAIYSITPTSEQVAHSAIEHIRAKPVNVYYLPEPKAAAPSHYPDEDEVETAEKKLAVDLIATLRWIKREAPAGWNIDFDQQLSEALNVADRFEMYCPCCTQENEHATGTHGTVCLSCGYMDAESTPF